MTNTKTTKTATETKTCQICGRGIKMVAGVIAHHGYSRPGDGQQTASCKGARALPYEVASDLLAAYVGDLQATAARQEAALAAPVESVFVTVGMRKATQTHLTVTADNVVELAAVHPGLVPYGVRVEAAWPALVANERRSRSLRLDRTRAYLAHQSARLAAWVAPV